MPIKNTCDKSVWLCHNHLIWAVVPWYHQSYEKRWGGSCKVKRVSDSWKASSLSCWKDLREIYSLSVSWISWVPQSLTSPPQLMILVWQEAQACWMSCTQRELLNVFAQTGLITTCPLMLTFSYLSCFKRLLVNMLLIGGLVQSLPNGQKSKE